MQIVTKKILLSFVAVLLIQALAVSCNEADPNARAGSDDSNGGSGSALLLIDADCGSNPCFEGPEE